MGYMIECRMPSCGWRTKRPGDYVATEAMLMSHLLNDHTVRETAEALMSSWQYSDDGRRREGDDPLTFVREHHDDGSPPEPPTPPEPKKKRRSRGRKARFARTYAQMIREAFIGAAGGALTTTQIREYMCTVTGAIIPEGSVCATLHKMSEDDKIEHVAKGQWKWHEAAI